MAATSQAAATFVDTLLASSEASAATLPVAPTGPSQALPNNIPYRDLYVQAGKTCPEVSPAMLAAQGNQESGFNPRAQSHMGAQGIAQFLPSTFKSWSNGDIWDPADAIQAQAKMMCAAMAKYKDWGISLASYNAGAGAVQKYGGIPPFKETRTYVSTIFATEKGYTNTQQ